MLRNFQRPHEDTHQYEAEQQDDEVRQDQPERIGEYDVALLREQIEARLQAVGHQRAEHHGGGCAAGDAKGEHRDLRSADNCVVADFGSHDALHDPGAEFFGLLGKTLGFIIGYEGRYVAARARHDADNDPDHTGYKRDPYATEEILQRLPEYTGGRIIGSHGALFPSGAQEQQGLRDGEQPDERRDHVDPAHEFHGIEGKAGIPGDRVHAHAGKNEADKRADHALEDIARRKGSDDRQCEHAQPELFGRTEFHRHVGEGHGQKQERRNAEDPSEHRRNERRKKGFLRLPLHGHRVSVERGAEGRRRSRSIDENGRDGPAVL